MTRASVDGSSPAHGQASDVVDGSPGVSIDVAAGASLHAEIAGVVTVDGPPGAVSGRVTIDPTAPSLPADLRGFTVAVSAAVAITFEEQPTAALEIRFVLPDPSKPVVAIHVAADGTVTALPSKVDGSELLIVTDHFSVVGWFSPVWNFVDAPVAAVSCGIAPSWAVLASSPTTVQACISSKQASDGRVLAELAVTSNRSVWQEISMSAGPPPEYVRTEDQADWTTTLEQQLRGPAPIVRLLAPGKRISIGFAQPTLAQDVTLSMPPPDGWTWAVSVGQMLLAALGTAAPGALESGSLVAALSCLGVSTVPFAVPALSAIDEPTVARCVIAALIAFTSDPDKALGSLPPAIRALVPHDAYLQASSDVRSLGNVNVSMSLLLADPTIATEVVDHVNSLAPATDATKIVMRLTASGHTTPTHTTPTHTTLPTAIPAGSSLCASRITGGGNFDFLFETSGGFVVATVYSSTNRTCTGAVLSTTKNDTTSRVLVAADQPTAAKRCAALHSPGSPTNVGPYYLGKDWTPALPLTWWVCHP